MEKPFVRDAYNYDTDEVSRDTGLFCPEETKTIQSQAEDADINVIVRRFGVTGVMPGGVIPPTYGDFTGVFDYQSAQNAVIQAREAFLRVPAEIRKRFDNDPQAFVDFCSDEKNLDEMRKMGLAVEAIKKPEAEKPPAEGEANKA